MSDEPKTNSPTPNAGETDEVIDAINAMTSRLHDLDMTPTDAFKTSYALLRVVEDVMSGYANGVGSWLESVSEDEREKATQIASQAFLAVRLAASSKAMQEDIKQAMNPPAPPAPKTSDRLH